HASARATYAVNASDSGASPGGNTAASSTSPRQASGSIPSPWHRLWMTISPALLVLVGWRRAETRLREQARHGDRRGHGADRRRRWGCPDVQGDVGPDRLLAASGPPVVRQPRRA